MITQEQKQAFETLLKPFLLKKGTIYSAMVWKSVKGVRAGNYLFRVNEIKGSEEWLMVLLVANPEVDEAILVEKRLWFCNYENGIEMTFYGL